MNFAKGFNLSFGILIFSAIVTGAIFAALLSKTLPSYASGTLYFCQQIISNIIFGAYQNFSGLLFYATGLILFLGLFSFIFQLFKTRLLLKKLLMKKVNLPVKFKKTITSLNIYGKVVLIRDHNLFSFCYGIFSSRIMVTTGLVASLTGKELEAVLLHEKAHLDNFDSLKIILGRTISSMFFFLPIFTELHQNMAAGSELLADRFTIRKQHGGQFLKAAIKKILASPQVNPGLSPAVANPDHLEIRIRSLVNPALKVKLSISPVSIITSLIFVFFSVLLLQTPAQAFQTKHPNGQQPQECNRPTQKSGTEIQEPVFTPPAKLKYSNNYPAGK